MRLSQIKEHFGSANHAVTCAKKYGYANVTRHLLVKEDELSNEYRLIFKDVVKKMSVDFLEALND